MSETSDPSGKKKGARAGNRARPPAAGRARLLLATRNRAKWRECRALLTSLASTHCDGSGPELLSLHEFPEAPEVEETGATFEENARLKAVSAARATGLPAIADDSGLVVDAIGGAPGVLSARFAGPGATDGENNARLLDMLEGVPEARRSARFVCALALAAPDGETRGFRGACEGVMLRSPRGSGGFGYDPVFFSPELGATFAEDPEGKSRVSHRARAIHAFGSALAGGELDGWLAERERRKG